MNELSSCISKEPFIKLGDGEAPILNYNLPQETCFKVYGRIPFIIPSVYFKKEVGLPPKYNFWELYGSKKLNDIKTELSAQLNNQVFGSGISANLSPLKNKVNINSSKTEVISSVKSAKSTKKIEPVIKEAAIEVSKTKGISLDFISEQISKGYQPIPYKKFNGEYNLYYLPKPNKPSPQIFILETYNVCSYLGDYGAGKTLNVLSLLPGEKTQISIKTYQEKESTQTKSENILDSFSETSAEEFEELLKEESGQSESTVKNSGFSLNLSQTVSVTVPVEGVTIGSTTSGDAGYKNDKTHTTTSNVNNIQQTLSKQVESSSHTREIEVNVTTSETVKTGEETSIIRQIENINRSRVLNIVFRQLLQEYITIISLSDVKVVYTNGYPESTVIMSIFELEDKLKDVIVANKVKEVKEKIIKEYCTVYNYLGKPKDFLEKVVHDYKDCDCLNLSEKKEFCRINKNLVDEAEGIKVDGVILSVKKRILRTPAIIADALLGQGEALDCYNMELQKAAVEKAKLENEKSKLALGIINSIKDDEKKALVYESFFNKKICCEENQGES